MFCRDVVSIPI
jgi:hypothetical protein